MRVASHAKGQFMKTIKFLTGLVLVASLGLNVWLWQQRSKPLAATDTAGASVAAKSPAEHEMPISRNAADPASGDQAVLELARLRNEVGQLRKQAAETAAWRAQAAETAQLRAQLIAAKKKLSAAEDTVAEAAQLTPEEVLALKGEAQATTCVSNMKQIGLAAHLYAQEHGNVFPPDLASLKNELGTPNVLFCPATPGGVSATEWSQLNPATIGYQFLNPNGNARDPQKPLSMCPLHGHVVYSDASVQRGKK